MFVYNYFSDFRIKNTARNLMGVNKEFIAATIKNIYESSGCDIENELSCCSYSDVSLNSNYNDFFRQKLYVLKYFPAYYFEYCILVNELKERIKKADVSVVSLGCGAMLDFLR